MPMGYSLWEPQIYLDRAQETKISRRRNASGEHHGAFHQWKGNDPHAEKETACHDDIRKSEEIPGSEDNRCKAIADGACQGRH